MLSTSAVWSFSGATIGCAPDRLAQRGGGAVRIVLQMVGHGSVGSERLRARPERGLVRGELEHARDAGRRALARHIGVDIEHAGSRLRAQGGHRWLQWAAE